MKKVFCMMIVFIYATGCAFAEMSKALVNIKFSEGVEAYKNAHYDQAIDSFEEILKEKHESGPIYFNLGNSYFRQGKIGKAVLNYERGLQLSPRDSDLKFNDQYVLNKVKQVESMKAQSVVSKFIDSQIRFYTLGELVLIVTVLIVITGIFFILNLTMGYFKSGIAVILASLIFLISVPSAEIILKINQCKNAAVVIQDAQAKFEPRKDATTHFETFEGSQVKIITEDGGWVKIKRFDGKLGWIEKTTVEKI